MNVGHGHLPQAHESIPNYQSHASSLFETRMHACQIRSIGGELTGKGRRHRTRLGLSNPHQTPTYSRHKHGILGIARLSAVDGWFVSLSNLVYYAECY